MEYSYIQYSYIPLFTQKNRPQNTYKLCSKDGSTAVPP